MSIVSIVIGFLPDLATFDTHIKLLSVGPATLAAAALQMAESHFRLGRLCRSKPDQTSLKVDYENS